MGVQTDLRVLPVSTGTSLRTRDGAALPLRPLLAGEREPVQAVFDGMSPQSRWLRFLTGVPELSERMLARLTDVDHVRHGAWVVSAAGAPVAVARWVRLGAEPQVAEIALSVVDAWQGRGLGRALVGVLGVAASDVGVTSLAWSIDVENRRALRLAGAYQGTRQVSAGVVEARTALPPTDGVPVEAVRMLSLRARFDALVRAAA
jgi:GNAT superfamily N-acetyltransferase